MKEEGGILIFETGGLIIETNTRKAWCVFEYTSHKKKQLGYQDKSEGKSYPIVNTVTKVWIQGIYMPALLMTNYAKLMDYPKDTEYLTVNFYMTKHRETVDITPINLGGDGGL